MRQGKLDSHSHGVCPRKSEWQDRNHGPSPRQRPPPAAEGGGGDPQGGPTRAGAWISRMGGRAGRGDRVHGAARLRRGRARCAWPGPQAGAVRAGCAGAVRAAGRGQAAERLRLGTFQELPRDISGAAPGEPAHRGGHRCGKRPRVRRPPVASAGQP